MSSIAMQKKLEEEVRLVLALAVKDFGLNPEALETIIASRGYTREKSTKPKVITEDLGKIFEMAICLVYGIPFIGKYKYAMEEAQELKEKIKKLRDVFPVQLQHTAKSGNRYDFGNADKTKYLSAKTTKKDGKVSPQVIGQPSRKKFCAFFKLEPTCNLDQIKLYIQSNVNKMLASYFTNTFDCPIVYYNKHKDIKHFITLKENIKWDHHTIHFSHVTKQKKWNESSSISVNGVTIGEFQIHNNRDCIKFRWAFEKLLELFSDNFDIIDLT